MYLCGTDTKVWWLCPRGHSYEMRICSRTGNQKGNCPYCSNQKLLKGFNDFETLHPEMLSEWDYELNEFLPSEIGTGTHKKVWWKCPFGHKYQTYPSNRVGKAHTGCPICAKEGHTYPLYISASNSVVALFSAFIIEKNFCSITSPIGI